MFKAEEIIQKRYFTTAMEVLYHYEWSSKWGFIGDTGHRVCGVNYFCSFWWIANKLCRFNSKYKCVWHNVLCDLEYSLPFGVMYPWTYTGILWLYIGVWVIFGDIAGQVTIILCFVISAIVECPNPHYDSNTIVNTQQVLYHYTATMQLTCATGYSFQQEQLVGLPLPITVECGFGGKWANFLEIPRCTRKWKSWIYLQLNFGNKTNRGLKKIGINCAIVSLLSWNIEVYWKTVLWISGLNNKVGLVLRWSLSEIVMH